MLCGPGDGIIPAMSSAPVRPLPAPRAARRKPAAPRAAKAVLTPEDWVRAATQVLVDHGIDHVRVDVLAGELAVTRGSFYWHFRDREDLLRRVLQAWREETTVQLTRRLAVARSEPRELLADVITLPFRGRAAQRAARIELAIRAWARRDPMARQALDEADAARIAYHEALFQALGFGAAEAGHRAFLMYGYEVAESLMAGQGGEAQREQRRRFVLQLLQQPLPA
jgi:AcrR family transcriptional regulator